MSPPTYRDELAFALDVAHEAGKLVARFYRDGAKSWDKSKDNPVTEADLAADASIRSAIKARYPDDGLLTEESEDDLRRLDCSRAWIVDPIDGTREFTKQIPEFAVSIGLVVEGEPVLGVIHNPAVDVTIAGSLGDGVEKNGQPTRVSQCTSLAAAHMVASRSEHKDGKLDRLESQFASLRPTGSIAWKLALVACGDADFNLSLKPKHEWDVCAGDFLVHEAGGAYVDLDGKRARYNQRDAVHEQSMIAGPHPLVEAFTALHEARARS